MIKLITKIIYITLLLLLGLMCLVTFLVSTTPGLYTTLKLSQLFIPGTLKVQHLKGRLIDKFSADELEYEYQNTKVKVTGFKLSWTIKTLLQHQLQIDSLKAKKIEIAGSDLQLEQIKAKISLTREQLKIESLQCDALSHHVESQLRIETQAPHTLLGIIKLNHNSKNQTLPKGTINIGGDLKQLHWTGDINGPAQLSLNGSIKNQTELNQIIKWRHLNWQGEQEKGLNSPEGRVKISGNLPHLNIQLTTKINSPQQDNWQINSAIEGTIPWQWDFTMNASQAFDTKSRREGLYTQLALKGAIKSQDNGSFTLTIAPGHYQLPEDSILSSLQFMGGTLKGTLSPKQFSGKGSLTIDKDTKIKLDFNLPEFNPAQGISSNQVVSAELSLMFNSFDFLKNLSPEISNPKGQLIASLRTSGTLSKPRIESQVHLSKGSVNLPQLGLALNDIDLTVSAKKKHWETTGYISSANKKILIKGRGPLDTAIKGDLSVEGSDFPLINTKEYQINISPRLKLDFTQEHLNISGSVLVPFAQIKPQSFSNSITVPDDVVFKSKKKAEAPPPSLFNTSMDIQVVMGENVEINAKGLHAILTGAVNLKQLPKGPVNANGELNVQKGEYKAYGQDLAIAQGELIFTGGRLDNPGISLRAEKKIDTSTGTLTSSNQLFDFNSNNLQNANIRGNIIVGVEVSGRLTDPKIQLFSNPSILSQADILSMLVLGRPASQANKAGGQLLMAAISSMNLGSGTNGTQLLEQLKENLGFDFNVQSSSNYNLVTNQVSDSTALVVGKSLSKRIYLSYNVGLSQADPNVLTLKYLLNKFLSIQISSSDAGNGIDFLYTSSK
jgi:translocation and assembly module TamB